MICDEVFEGDRMLIFVSNFFLSLLFANDVETVFMDGTFKMVPVIFHQLFTINVFYGGQKQLPVVYALLKRKTTAAYCHIFAVLREKAVEQGKLFSPNSVLIDFETGLLRAIRQEMPNARLRGCLFHLSQCVYRKVKHLY